MTLSPNQTLWVEALRSGHYKQGTGLLCKNGAYCCLGVAAELFATPETRRETRDDGAIRFDGAVSVAPHYVTEALDLITDTGSITSRCLSLASLNDEGLTFDQIADVITNWSDDLFI